MNALTGCNDWIGFEFENDDYFVDIDSESLKIFVRKACVSNLINCKDILEADGYYILGPYKLFPENQFFVLKNNHSLSNEEFKEELDSLISEVNLRFSASNPIYYFYKESAMLNLHYDHKSDSYVHTLKPNNYLSEEFIVSLKRNVNSFLKMNDVNFLQIKVLIPFLSPVPPPNSG